MALHHNSGKPSLRHIGDVFKVLRKRNNRAPRAEDVLLALALNNNNNGSDKSKYRGDWNHLKLIQKIPEQHTGMLDVKELQKTATMGTAHILRQVLM